MQATSAQQQLLSLLDEAPMRPAHYRLWLLACGGTLLDGLSIFALGAALPLVTGEMQVGATMVGLIGAAIVLGAVVGAAWGGPAGDRLGRKKLMVADMAVIAAGALLSSVAPNALFLLAGQLLVGIGVGIDFPVSGAYVSELMPKQQRGRMMVATIACQSVGMLMAAAFAVAIFKLFDSSEAWRGVLGLNAVVALLFLIARLSIPESVRWLLSQGRNQEAATMLARVLPEEQANAQGLSIAAGNAVHRAALFESREGQLNWVTLFRREYLRQTILVSVPWFLMDVATYGVGLFTPVILGALHISRRANSGLAADFADIEGSGAVDLFLLFGFLLGLWLVPRVGRIRMQVIGFAGMTAGMLVLLAGTQYFGNAPNNIPFVIAGFVTFNLLMNAGPNATTFTLPAEFFPTQLRATASGFAAATAKVGATCGVFLLPIVKGRFGISTVLLLMACVSLLGLAVTAVMAREIREVAPLEDQQRKVESEK